MKRDWKLFLGVILIIIIEGFIFIGLKDLSISNKIQAGSTIVLVLITLYYAIQTQMLVKETKEKRNSGFWEKRIIEFYNPFIDKLKILAIHLRGKSRNGEKLIKKIDELREFFLERKYMISKSMSKQIDALQDALWTALLDDEDLRLENYFAAEEEVRKIINKEWADIEDKIRKFYGY